MNNFKYSLVTSFLYACVSIFVYIFTVLVFDVELSYKPIAFFGIVAFFGMILFNAFLNTINTPEEQKDDISAIDLTNIQLPAYFYYDFINGFARVERIQQDNDKNLVIDYNFVNKEGKFISDKWWVEATDFITDNCAAVSDGKMCNLIDANGNLKSTMWFHEILKFSDDKIAKVKWNNDGTINFINADGKLMLDEWKKEL